MSVFRSEEDRKEFVDYMLEEIALAEAERDPKLRDFKRYREQRMAVPDRKKRNWPWPKASNICTPLALINTNGTFGSLKSTFGLTDPRVTVKSQLNAMEKPLKAFNKLLNLYVKSTKRININEVDNTMLYDCGSLGTQFVRVTWDKDVFRLKRKVEGDNVIEKDIVRRNSPAIIPYRIEDVLTRIHFTNVHNAPWILTYSYLHEHELMQRQARNIFNGVKEMIEQFALLNNDAKQSENIAMGFSPTEDGTYQILEINAFWDTDGDGVYEDIKVWMEKATGKVLREEFNELGRRDIVRLPYIHIPYSVYALGVGAIVDHMQQEADTLHNLRINQQIMALAPMIKRKTGSGKVGDQTVRPGGTFWVDDMNDLDEFRTHDFSNMAFESEFIVREYAGQATSINNSMLGLPDVYAKTRGTSSGYMFQAQQSVRQFTSSVVENIKTGYSEIFNLVVLQMIMHRDDLDYGLIEQDEAEMVRTILSVNPEDFTTTFNCEVNITEQTETDEAKKQARIMLIQFYTQYGQQLIQLSMLLENPQIPPKTKEFAARLITGATKILDEILEDFDKRDERGYLPFVADLELMLQVQDAAKMQQIQQMIMKMTQSGGGGMGAVMQPGPQSMPGMGQGGMNAG